MRSLAVVVPILFGLSSAFADGLVVPLKSYDGSLAERSQEAIIVFTGGTEEVSAKQDLILKIQVEGEAKDFAWVVPLPNGPETAKADAKLFKECFNYVQHRLRGDGRAKGYAKPEGVKSANVASDSVTVISRKVVGSYDVAVVRENDQGSLSGWLEENGYQPLAGADSVIEHYRKKKYVFACVRVTDAEAANGSRDLHPLRFSFETGGRDGIYFPMKLTGLQKGRFDVNLYVFYGAWLNDSINGYGYEHRGFSRKYRDYDGPKCDANAGKTYSLPKKDPFLASAAHTIPTLTKFFQARYPGERFYLTNISARNLDPEAVRDWKDDLWLYPYYTDKKFVPYDAR